MKKAFFVLFAAAVFLLFPHGVPAGDLHPELPDDEARTLMDLNSIVLSCEAFETDNGKFPGPTEGYVPADFLLSWVEPMYIGELPKADAWGNPFLYWSDGTQMSVVTYWRDGLPDEEYLTPPPPGAPETGGDVVYGRGRMLRCPDAICNLAHRGEQKRTMADIRSVGVVVESFAIDNGSYPGPTPGVVDVSWMREQVEPVYIRRLPLIDAWGAPFLYWSDGESYRIASKGSNGLAEVPHEQVVPGTTTSTFTADIVFANGQFVQWPEGPQR